MTIIILGIITPYIDYFVIFQMFFLLIPFACILVFSLALFIINCIIYKKEVFKIKSTKIITLLPLFLLMQIISTFIVQKIQRFRSEQIITNIEDNGKLFSDSINENFGIKYNKLNKLNSFQLEYKRGFFVREVYDSERKTWESYGWGD